MENNYTKLEKEKFPKVEALSKDAFGYIDILNIDGIDIYIMFICDKLGIPSGNIANTYFDYADTPLISNEFWLVDYKKDLLNRIRYDLEQKKCLEEIMSH